MEEPKDIRDINNHLIEGRSLWLVNSEKLESLLPDPELKILIETMKGKSKTTHAKVSCDDGPEAA